MNFLKGNSLKLELNYCKVIMNVRLWRIRQHLGLEVEDQLQLFLTLKVNYFVHIYLNVNTERLRGILRCKINGSCSIIPAGIISKSRVLHIFTLTLI